jgi:hypothetical protein
LTYVCLVLCSLEEGSERASKKETNAGADTQEHTGKLIEVNAGSVAK